MRTTIFFRILLAAFIPLLLVLILIISTINNIVYDRGSSYARDTAMMAASQYSELISQKISGTQSMMEVAARALSNLDFNSPKARRRPKATIAGIMEADPSIYSTWFAIEPGLYPDGLRYYQTLLRTENGYKEIFDINDEDLADPELSPWYNISLKSGQPYLTMLNPYDYGQGLGPEMVAEMSFPLYAGEKVVGCVGADFRFADFFAPGALSFGRGQKVKLLSADGVILSSNDQKAAAYRTLADYRFDGFQDMAEALKKGEVYFSETYSPVSEAKSFVALIPINLAMSEKPLFIYLDIPVDELYAATNNSIELIYFTSGIGFLLLLFGVFVTTRNIVRPIGQLTRDFEKIADGNLNVSGRDRKKSSVVELDILQSSLWKVLEQIKLNHDLSLKAAEERVEKEKVLAASEAKTHFFANMSHEIRTPMNAILGIAEILLHDEPLTDRQTRYIDDIKISSESLLTIINDILDLSKLESGKLQLVPVNYNFRDLMANIKSLARYLAENKSLIFVYEEEKPPPLCLYGDDVRLRQILLNILSNAVKFTPEGAVTMTLKEIGESLVFSITDTGIGIKPEDMKTLFEPFSQMDTTRNRSIQGTGLGLSICRNLTNLMGGTISVDSSYGRGSTFTVTIPKVLGDEDTLLCGGETGDVSYDPALKILIVDDNAINLSVAAGLLKTIHGLNSDRANSGYEAIEMVTQTKYDLIFMDHMMPGIDGVETARRIRELGPEFKELPFIALTANAVQGTKEMMLASGMDDFLAKPIVKEELGAMLYKWIDSRYKSVKCDQQALSCPPADPAGDWLTARLSKINGLNPASGLASAGGQEDLYLEMISLLAEEAPRAAGELRDLLAINELKNFGIKVHALKSSLASIGALELSSLAAELEEASLNGRDGDCRDKLPEFADQLTALGRALSTVRAEGPGLGRTEEAGADGAVGRLKEALAVYDYELIMESLKEAQGREADEATKMTLAEVKKKMRAFDYEGAAELLPVTNINRGRLNQPRGSAA